MKDEDPDFKNYYNERLDPEEIGRDARTDPRNDDPIKKIIFWVGTAYAIGLCFTKCAGGWVHFLEIS